MPRESADVRLPPLHRALRLRRLAARRLRQGQGHLQIGVELLRRHYRRASRRSRPVAHLRSGRPAGAGAHPPLHHDCLLASPEHVHGHLRGHVHRADLPDERGLQEEQRQPDHGLLEDLLQRPEGRQAGGQGDRGGQGRPGGSGDPAERAARGHRHRVSEDQEAHGGPARQRRVPDASGEGRAEAAQRPHGRPRPGRVLPDGRPGRDDGTAGQPVERSQRPAAAQGVPAAA
mmetsp:Transcript_14282/g.42584  ORF Transcript_14282/g.42584 Transcript_14282/m.42584 type:complete len:231 (-) Transcript_14282:653-1345(-)